MPGVTPRMRLIVGLSLFIISSMFLEVMPYSSASIMALSANDAPDSLWHQRQWQQ